MQKATLKQTLKKSEYNIAELYAGTGRLSEPFMQWDKANISYLVDLNKHARETFVHNHPEINYINADLEKATLKSLGLVDKNIDIVLGCPPCQGFSDSGKRESDDPRNDHIMHFIKLAVAMKPLIIAMENVPFASLSQHFSEATAYLDKAGYKWNAGILNAADYGSVQSRHRLVLMAVKKDFTDAVPALPKPSHVAKGRYYDYNAQLLKNYKQREDSLLGSTASIYSASKKLNTKFYDSDCNKVMPKLNQVIGDLPKIGSIEAEQLGHQSWKHGNEILKAMKVVPEGGRRKTKKRYYGAAYARLHRNGLARTITTYFPNAGSGRFWHPTENRAITLREAARIQGFPDSFKFIGGATTANAVLVGNALDKSLANATYSAIRKMLE